MADFGRENVIAHNDPSPAREEVLRYSEQRHSPINIQVALPSLDAIKRAVEMRMGVALLPRRCALTELALGQLVAVRVPQVRLPRDLRLVYRKGAELSQAAGAFLEGCERIRPAGRGVGDAAWGWGPGQMTWLPGAGDVREAVRDGFDVRGIVEQQPAFGIPGAGKQRSQR